MLNHSFLNQSTFQGGVIFAGELNNKGEILASFIDKYEEVIKKNIEEVIFIDDSMKNVSDVEEKIKKRGINYKGIHYTKLNYLEKEYNHEKAEQELAGFFIRLLSLPEKEEIEFLLRTDRYIKEVYTKIFE